MSSLEGWISENIPDVVMQDAAAWLARLDSQHCGPADRLAFTRWLAEDPTHRWAYQELSEVWARLRTLEEVGEQAAKESKVVPFPAGTGLRYDEQAARPSRDWSTLAVVLTVLLAAAMHFLMAAPQQVFKTKAAEIMTVQLDDGSRVVLNSKTRLVVSMDERRRHIELERGEAVFDVASDDRPFIVHTAHGTAAALGTSFAVDTRVDRAEVSVITGVVAVSAAAGEVALTELDTAVLQYPGNGNARLRAGERAVMMADAVRAQFVPGADIQRGLSWRNGNAQFVDQPLHRVVEEMQRYTDLNMHLGNPKLGATRISGRFSTQDIDDFLTQLSRRYGIFVDRADRGWVVLRSSEVPGKNRLPE